MISGLIVLRRNLSLCEFGALTGQRQLVEASVQSTTSTLLENIDKYERPDLT